jgi:hypothetical protein
MFNTHNEGTKGSANCAIRHLYIEYLNNYLTVDNFAANHNIDLDVAKMIIDQGRIYHDLYCEHGFEITHNDL